jgi:hypothetical protein
MRYRSWLKGTSAKRVRVQQMAADSVVSVAVAALAIMVVVEYRVVGVFDLALEYLCSLDGRRRVADIRSVVGCDVGT